MVFPPQKETYDSNTSSHTPMNGAQYRRSSKRTTIQSYRGSISNSSVHTTSTAATDKGLFDYSEQSPGGLSSISHRKYFHSLEKSTFRIRNQSQSSIDTISEAGSVPGRSYTATSTSKQETRLLNTPSFEDEDESPLPSTSHSSQYNLSTLPEPGPSSSRYGVPPSVLLDDPSTKPFGDSQPFAATEIPTADKPPARHPSSLPPSSRNACHGAPMSVNAFADESRNSPNADDALTSQSTVASSGTVVGRPAPQFLTVSYQRSAAVASLAKAAGAVPRRREKKKEDKANEANIVKRLQQICTDGDPSRLYRNLVKIGPG